MGNACKNKCGEDSRPDLNQGEDRSRVGRIPVINDGAADWRKEQGVKHRLVRCR